MPMDKRDIETKLDQIMATDGRHRGIIIAHGETVNLFLSMLLAASESENGEEISTAFYEKYACSTLGGNIRALKDNRVELLERVNRDMPAIVGDLMGDLAKIKDNRNRMGHSIPETTERILMKDLDELKRYSHYFYFNPSTKQREFLRLNNDNVKGSLDIISRMITKLQAIRFEYFEDREIPDFLKR